MAGGLTVGSLSGPLGSRFSQTAGGTIGTKESINATGGTWYRDANGKWVQNTGGGRAGGIRGVVNMPTAARAGSSQSGSAMPASALGGAGGGGGNTNISNMLSGILGGGGVGGAAGGVGGTAGAGSGIMRPQAPTANYTAQTQQNPYIKQLMDLSLGQFAKPLDRAKERADMREELTRRQRESMQTAASQGRGGMWGSQQQQNLSEAQRALTGQEAGFADRETAAKNALLGTMTGIAGAGTADIGQQLQHILGASKLAQDSAQWQAEYPYRMKALADQSVNSRLGALSSIIGLL
jgi:hypothetical protein